MNGFMIAAPHSGAGKTMVTLGLLRALRNRGVALAAAKAGPDYIDPAFHAAASGGGCVNLDPWGMRGDLIRANVSRITEGEKSLVVEAMMGLFDAAADGRGSAADLAARLRLPVVLVIDVSRMAHSVAALAKGFRDHRPDLFMAGVVANKTGSERHVRMLREALEPEGLRLLGAIPRDERLVLPERHLGLVQAGEHAALEDFIAHAAQTMEKHCDMAQFSAIRVPAPQAAPANVPRVPPLAQHIAVARDEAFAFAYAHLLDGWQRRGVTLSFFSPLADEGPAGDAGAVYLPGGYPELHGATIAAADRFHAGMAAARDRGATIYGECGGYMALGAGLTDADGTRHRMLGLLPLETTFANRRRHLGYRRLKPLTGLFNGAPLTGHEFHYTTVVTEGPGDPLFAVEDAVGADLGATGLVNGPVCGSFMHVIDIVEQA